MRPVFQTPEIDALELGVLRLIEELRTELADSVAEPRRWFGTLRRMSFARAVQASNSIEGYDASLDDVVAAVEGEPTLDANEETQLALGGYRDAMTYVLQIAPDEHLNIDEGLLKSLHFMMMKHDLTKHPGQWRPGVVFVRRESTGQIVYEGPPHDDVPELVASMLAELERDSAPALIRAAMAHLNLVMIHPFSDGNGRMARCLQTLILARDQVLAPVFSSIEEYLGRNTEAYYDILGEVGDRSWSPGRDARPWIKFCLTAHYLQARTSQRRRQEIEELFNACVDLTTRHGLSERCAAGLLDTAFGLRLRRGMYRSTVDATFGEEISDLTATRDLKAMVDVNLLEPIGERRGRYYVASKQLHDVREKIRASRPPRATDDPFALAANQLELAV